MSGPGYTLYDAGVLDMSDNLTVAAEQSFMDDLHNEINRGSIAPPMFPCLPSTRSGPHKLNVMNSTRYRILVADGLENYRKIAVALNVRGKFALLPLFFDPTVLISMIPAIQVNLPNMPTLNDVALQLPNLIIQITPQLTRPDIALEIEKLLDVSIPSLNLPQIPSFDPRMDLSVLMENYLWPLKMPDLMIQVFELLLNIPELFKIFALDLSEICKIFWKSNMFGQVGTPLTFVRLALQKVLIKKMMECMTISMMGSIVGSSSIGIVGLMGREVASCEPPISESTSTRRITGRKIVAVPGLPQNTDVTFRQRLLDVSDELNIDVDYMATVMSIESNKTFDPAVKSPYSSATGLIQFLESTAKRMGTSTQELSNMTATEQLEYVKRFYESVLNNGRIRVTSPGILHVATFSPGVLQRGGTPSDDTVIADKNKGINPTYVDANPGFAVNGVITIGSAGKHANNLYHSVKYIKKEYISADDDSLITL